MKGPTEIYFDNYLKQMDVNVEAVKNAVSIVKNADEDSLAKLSFGKLEGTPSFAYSTETMIYPDEFALLEKFLTELVEKRTINRTVITANRHGVVHYAKEIDSKITDNA